MGLFDKLFSNEVKNKLEEARKKAEEAIGGALDQILPDEKKAAEEAKKAEETVKEAEKAAETVAATAQAKVEPIPDAVGSEIEDRGTVAYFKEVIEKNLPGTEVREGVTLSELNVSEPKRNEPPTAVVYKDGAPAAALYIVKKNSYKREGYMLAMAACQAAGIPALRFMKEFRNDPGYVAGRVHAVVK